MVFLVNVFAAVLAVTLAAAPEPQESFLAMHARAEPVDDLAETLLPYLQTCSYPEPYLSRQCAALKERLMFLGTSRLFRYTAAGAATLDGRQVVLRACLTCGDAARVQEGLTGGGFVLGRVPRGMRTKAASASARFEGIELGRVPLADADPAKVAPALITEFLFRARNELPRRIHASASSMILVDVVGYRVYDRCAGKVFTSWPGDGGTIPAVEQTDPTCPGYVKPVVKVVEHLPEKLTQDQIRKVLEGAREDVLVCYDKYGVGGYAPAKITVTGQDGRIFEIVIAGKFENTATAECIDKVMRAVRFPRFLEKELHIDWQFFLQD